MCEEPWLRVWVPEPDRAGLSLGSFLPRSTLVDNHLNLSEPPFLNLQSTHNKNIYFTVTMKMSDNLLLVNSM